MNREYLAQLIKERSIKKMGIAQALNIHPSAFAAKLAGRTIFKDYEIRTIIKYLNLTPAEVYTLFN